ncbi:SDR family NAD(P)-dependent oxidoreductase [Thermogemmatispora sp.]|uniref:SDR family NAD(P)-dependent oxidoreductase n=1 Tax=Thermogemmatispora sp. TaxID=1968838 RepID=UPI001DC5798A|nr:SDR family oxidoreductase [Thermogemmatispora sp.]MBX5449493.1 SDR family oxidoreductase [Thermogemmatispora sp.]
MAYHYRGKTALITGASSGIGLAFAQALAARGMHLILVARSEERLRQLAKELRERHAVRAEVIATDLSREGAATQIASVVQERGLSVDLLINNAGFGTYGPFVEQSAAREHQEIMLNVTALVDLTHALLPSMLARGEGAIINLASLAAFLPIPHMAVYAATKAFVLSFSQALWAEYRRQGLRVLAVCPGPVATNFFAVMGTSQEGMPGLILSPEQVVTASLRALERGRSQVVPGLLNKLMAFSTRLVPRTLGARVAASFLPRRSRPGQPAASGSPLPSAPEPGPR